MKGVLWASSAKIKNGYPRCVNAIMIPSEFFRKLKKPASSADICGAAINVVKTDSFPLFRNFSWSCDLFALYGKLASVRNNNHSDVRL